MKPLLSKCIPALLAVIMAAPGLAADWRLALPGWRYEFPRDHFIHSDFKTEWWYFTGLLADERGNRFGFQLTFFRQGLRAPNERNGETSRFLVNDLKFAHFAISDISAGQFHFQQKLTRGAFDEAGFGAPSSASPQKLARIDDWSLEWLGGESFRIHAKADGIVLDLRLNNAKPWVTHGQDGVSQKAEGAGHASHYFSGTRMVSEGQLTIGGKTAHVSGESWLDREWATNQLSPAQAGWNWFSIQLDDGRELMLYQMRLTDGSLDSNSSGTFIARVGSAQHLRRDDYQLTSERFWTSPDSGGKYPIGWRLSIPSLAVSLRITTPLSKQELVLKPIAYWEGLIDVEGAVSGKAVRGQGYMELTGYAGRLGGLSQEAVAPK